MKSVSNFTFPKGNSGRVAHGVQFGTIAVCDLLMSTVTWTCD
jgi:hypothetical protein